MDIPLYENKRIPGEYKISDINGVDDMSFDDDYFEVSYLYIFFINFRKEFC